MPCCPKADFAKPMRKPDAAKPDCAKGCPLMAFVPGEPDLPAAGRAPDPDARRGACARGLAGPGLPVQRVRGPVTRATPSLNPVPPALAPAR